MASKKPNYYFEIKPKSKLGLNLHELIEHRELIYFLAWRDIKVKYKQTILGFLWAVLQPFIMMVILTFIAKKAFNLSATDIPYPIFTFSGFLLWNIFASGTTNAGNSLILNAEMIKKIYFPRIIIPIASTLVNVFDFFMGLALFICLLIFFRHPVDIASALIYWPAGLLVAFISTIGLGCWLAALNAKYRDLRHATPFMIQVLLFLTPVFFPVLFLKGTVAGHLVALNPMYAALSLFRAPLTTAEMNPELLYISIFSGVILLATGLLYFKHTEKFFADFI